MLFCHRTYGAVSVDDIAKKAKVSRATFYRHFSSKLDMFSALTDRLVARLHPTHEVFANADAIDAHVLDAWIGENIARFRKNAHLIRAIREAASIEPAFFRDHTIAHHDGIIENLGRTVTAFRRASSHAPANHRVRMKAHFLIRQMQMFCYDVAVTGWEDGREVGQCLLVGQFLSFIEEHRAEGRADTP